MRHQPTDYSEEIAIVVAGTLLELDFSLITNGWQYVRLETESFVSGWVRNDALQTVALQTVVQGVALHAEPDPASPFVRLLPPGRDVLAFESAEVKGLTWLHIWSADGVTGWAAEEYFSQYYVAATTDLVLQAITDQVGDPPAMLSEGLVAAVVEVTPDQNWLLLRAPDGTEGWTTFDAIVPVAITDRGVVRLPQSLRTIGANLRANPFESATVMGRLSHDTTVPVIGRNDAGNWLLVISPQGSRLWISSDLVWLTHRLVFDLPIVTSP